MNSTLPKLKLDWCSHEAAVYATKHWHYSGSMPAGKTVKIGVWEDKKFIGCVIYSRGANNNLLKPYGLACTEGCELTRIALSSHSHPVSRIIKVSLVLLKKLCPEIRLIISFTDSRQNHHGGVYQAANWIYNGYMETTPDYWLNGRWMHQRTVNQIFGSLKAIPRDTKKRPGGTRLRYILPLDEEMRRMIEPMRKKYPKRVKQAITSFPEAERRSVTDPHAPEL